MPSNLIGQTLKQKYRIIKQIQSRDNLAVDDLLAIRVPKSAAGCNQLLAALAALEKEIGELQNQIASGESELDDRVIGYYGLNANDRKVITNFLTKF